MSKVWLSEAWYVAALADEVGAGQMFARTILGEPVLLFRDQAGTSKAVADRCPHRFAPLHLGKLRDGIVTCGYHGLSFDGEGQCLHNPHGDGRILPGQALRSYPVREQQNLIWIWTGEHEPPASEAPPSFEFISNAPETALLRGYLPTGAHYQLIVDNIIDLSHADYLHPGLLGTGGAVSASTPAIRTVDKRVTCSWSWESGQSMGMFAPFLPDGGADSAGWLTVVWEAPARMVISSGASSNKDSGLPELSVTAAHLMTPRDSANTHYFYCGSRSFLTDNQEISDRSAAAVRYAFEHEDAPMLEATQRNMQGRDFWSMKPWILAGDGGAVRVRRILEGLLRQEHPPREALTAAAAEVQDSLV